MSPAMETAQRTPTKPGTPPQAGSATAERHRARCSSHSRCGCGMPNALAVGHSAAAPMAAASAVSMRAARRPTEFEQRVYKVISAIPKGQTRSYRWVAEQLGDVKLARAVGNALGRNPYAPKVPCHRVIKTDGSLGGYAGGLAKKLALLRKEGWRGEKAVSRKQ